VRPGQKTYLFAESPVWQLQQQYFTETGIDAWRQGEVPHYITSNPVVAKTYAGLVYAFLCDLANTHKGQEKVYLLELGSGHGRFCYHFLKHLDQLTANTGHSLPGFCYVLSDFTEGMLDYWKTHPRLQPYYQKGQLDHCLLNAPEAEEISLCISGKTIKKESLRQPLVVIANYFFDTIPQDLFFVQDHQVHHCHVTVGLPENRENKTAGEVIRGLTVSEQQKPLLEQKPYPEEFLNQIIGQYADQLESDTYVLFPHTGLRCMDHLAHLSNQGMILLTADRGCHRLSELENRPFPVMAVHGSFSYPVNYHAFKVYSSNREGIALFPRHQHESLVLGCLLNTPLAARLSETKLAFQRFVDDFSPDDFYTLKQWFVSAGSSSGLKELLAGLRLSGYDARFFSQLLPRLTELALSVNEQEKWNIFQVIHRVWEMYYPLGEEDDLAFNLGELLFNLQFPKEALAYFHLSDRLYGFGAHRSYNIALCHYAINDHITALRMAREIYEKAPDHSQNTALLNHLIQLSAP